MQETDKAPEPERRRRCKEAYMAQGSRALTLRILQEIWNAKTPSLIEELYSNDCVIHTPDGEVHGVEGSKHLYHT